MRCSGNILLPAARPALLRLGFLLAGALLALPTTLPAEDRPTSWAHQRHPLQPDPAVTWGSLDNGFRYALLPHAGQPGAISLRLIVFAGSLDEKDNELGIAHFLEHMAFNGTLRYPPGKLEDFFRELGMDAGYDINATTTFEHTVYTLELPSNHATLVTQGLEVLRDFADGMLLDPAEIERERGVILSEMRGRGGLEMRRQVSAHELFFPGHLFPRRNPIGTEASIASLQPAQFQDFYRRLYRPDNMVLVAVGDFTADAFASSLAGTFSSMVLPPAPLPPRVTGRLALSKGLRAGFYRISDIGSAALQFVSLQPEKNYSDNLATRTEQFERNLALYLFTERAGRLLQVPVRASGTVDRFAGHQLTQLQVETASETWKEALTGMDQLIRFTLQKGFTDREFYWFRKRKLLELAKLRDQLPTLPPSLYADAIQDSILEDRVFLPMDQRLALEQERVRGITSKALTQAFQRSWNLDTLAVHLSGDVQLEKGTPEILSQLAESRKSKGFFLLSEAARDIEFTPIDYGPPGTVVARREVPEFCAHLLRFQNNLRLNFIPSDREPGLVQVLVRVGDGLFDLPPKVPGLREIGLPTLMLSGAGRFPPEEISALAATHFLSFDLHLNDHDAFTFSATLGREELPAFFGLVSEFLTKPQFFGAVNQQLRFRGMMATSGVQFGLGGGFARVQNLLFGSDNRFTHSSPAELLRVGTFDVQTWMEPAFTRGYLEVSVVGDISLEQLTRDAAASLGALPSRQADKNPPASSARPVAIALPPGIHRVEFVGEPHLAMVAGFWPVLEPQSLPDQIALHLLSEILGHHLKERLREELGLAYSPTAEYDNRSEYPAYSMIQAMIDCSPEDTATIAQAVQDISSRLGQTGVTAIEFTRALRHLRQQVDKSWTSNPFLLDQVLKRAQEPASPLTDALALRDGSAFNAVTIERANAWARRILGPAQARIFPVVPKPFVGLFQESANPAAGKVIGGR